MRSKNIIHWDVSAAYNCYSSLQEQESLDNDLPHVCPIVHSISILTSDASFYRKIYVTFKFFICVKSLFPVYIQIYKKGYNWLKKRN